MLASMSKTRVLFEAGPMADIKKTGVGYYVDHLVSNLGMHSHDQLRLTGFYFDLLNRNHKQPPAYQGVDYMKIWLMPGKLLSICRRFGFQPFLEFFTLQRADLVLFTNYVSLPRLRGGKTGLIIYDLSFLDHPEYMQSVNLSYLQKFCPPSIQSADLIITISEFTKARLLHHYPNLKADVVITPIPPAPLTHPVRELSENIQSMGVSPKKYLLYLGTIEPRKNIEALVESYALLPKSIQDEYALVLAGGKGWKDEAILAAIEKHRANGLQIIQTGYISDDEKSALYANASLFIMPSHYEGFGMPILEAMQYEIPVAVSDIPVFHEVAGEAVVYFNKDDTQNIADVVQNVLKDIDKQHTLVKLGAKQLQTFSWQQNAALVGDAITRTIKK